MKKSFLFLGLVLLGSFYSSIASAQTTDNAQAVTSEETNFMDELDPFSPDVERELEFMDQLYKHDTGQDAFEAVQNEDAFNVNAGLEFLTEMNTCFRQECAVWARVVKSEQKLHLYVNGQLVNSWLVSTGAPGHGTPNFDTHPNGRIYDAYSSKKFPGGDYKGLGNMPYAVFISGGFAIHGTTAGNFPKLGKPASHGCIRVHPDNGKIFNRLVREHGIKNTWITVEH